MTDEPIEEVLRSVNLDSVMNKGELRISRTIKDAVYTLKADEIRNSIEHIQISLDKWLTSNKSSDLENIYWHIGAIKGALK